MLKLSKITNYTKDLLTCMIIVIIRNESRGIQDNYTELTAPPMATENAFSALLTVDVRAGH